MLLNPYRFNTAPPGPDDPYFADVTLLMNFENDAAGTSYEDKSSLHTELVEISPAGHELSTTEVKFGTKSFKALNLGDESGSYFEAQDATLFDFGANDFTIECFIFASTDLSYTGLDIIAQFDDFNPTGIAYLFFGFEQIDGTSEGHINVQQSLGLPPEVVEIMALGGEGISTLIPDEWNFVQYKRVGDRFSLLINGIEVDFQESSLAVKASFALPKVLSTYAGYVFADVYTDNLRVTKNVARPDAIPTEDFPIS